MHILKSKNEIFESILVFGFLLGILFPIRLLFVQYIADSWLGSLGVLTLFYVLLIFLIRKNKLGKFGKMIARQLFKIHTGKRRYFVYTNIIIITLFFSSVVYGMETAKGDTYQEKINQILVGIPIKSLKNTDDVKNYVETEMPKLSPSDFIRSFFILIFLPLSNHEQYIILWGLTDKMTDGWILNISIVILAEQIEVIGFLITIKFIIKEKLFNQ